MEEIMLESKFLDVVIGLGLIRVGYLVFGKFVGLER